MTGDSARMSKRGQIAIFVTIAIVIVAGIVFYFVLRGQVGGEEIPEEFAGIFETYSGCIEDETLAAVDLAGSQGGRVYLDDYVPGSDYAPFGNQLNFLGFPVQYWYYISGNGVVKENVPTEAEIEEDIARYVEDNLNNCNLDDFYEQGFYIELGEVEAEVNLLDDRVEVSLLSELVATKEGESVRKRAYGVVVNSKLGKFYNLASKIYGREAEDAFLENYSADVLRLYAPVDGVEISCSPKVWKTREVVDELKQGLEANIPAIKFRGNYYELSEGDNDYFVVDESVDESVNLIYSSDWPSRIEIYGAEDDIMVAEAVGNSAGMGVMGFCYVPYHFVYDVSFPVMVQIYDNREVFQFPVVVVIDKNVPRQGYYSELIDESGVDLCEFETQEIAVDVYDAHLGRVDADISYECFNQRCRLGEADNGRFVGNAPSCLNGYLVATAEGYTSGKILFSSNEEGSAEIILDEEQEVEVELEIAGREIEGTAIVSFLSDAKSASAALPESGVIRLSEGLYEIMAYVYDDSDITIPESRQTQCTEVPKSGLLGIFGGTRQECFEIVIPETKIESALVGGGSAEVYLFDSDLRKGKIKIEVDEMPKPDSLEQMQINYAAFEEMGLGVEFP